MARRVLATALFLLGATLTAASEPTTPDAYRVGLGDVLSIEVFQHQDLSGDYEIEKGTTLMRAVSQAGGLGPFASQRVEIRRDRPDGTTIVPVDLSRVRRGKDPDPEFRPGDVIIVERRFF